MTPLELAQTIAAILDDRQAQSIRVLDVRGRTSLSDYVIVASASATPHLKALQGHLGKQLREGSGTRCHRQSGDPDSAWIVMDFFDVVVHLFLPEAREYYDIEGLWEDVPDIAPHSP